MTADVEECKCGYEWWPTAPLAVEPNPHRAIYLSDCDACGGSIPLSNAVTLQVVFSTTASCSWSTTGSVCAN